jgi:hypothetical protein
MYGERAIGRRPMPRLRRLESFLLHESALVRDSVGFQFYQSWPRIEALAPLVLTACRRFGEEACFNLLSFGCRFPLSAGTLLETLWGLAETRPPFVELWVSLAPLSIVRGREELLRSVLSPRALARLGRRASFHRATPADLWRRLEGMVRRVGGPGPGEGDELDDLLEALAGAERGEEVARMLRDLDGVAAHLRPSVVALSGWMKLSGSEALVGVLDRGDDTPRAAVEALARVGSEAAVSAIGARYLDSSRRFRRFALAVLKAVKHESSSRLLQELARKERDPALLGTIFDGLRFHFTEESEALLRSELARPTSYMIAKEIEKALFVFAALRGAEAPRPEEEEIYFRVPFEGWDER